MRALALLLMLLSLALTGCVNTVKSVVTAPVKIVSKAADWTTTSQDEADRNRGRAMRAQEERLGELSRRRDKASAKCRKGDEDQCQRAEVLDHEIEAEISAPR